MSTSEPEKQSKKKKTPKPTKKPTKPPVTVTPTPTPVPTPTSTGFKGIYAFNNMTDTKLFSDNQYIAGTNLTYYLAQLNPEQGQYNWSLIDNDMAPWIAAGKKVIPRVSTSGWTKWQPQQNSKQGTPQWIYDLGVKHIVDADGAIKPEYWNPLFLSSLKDFVTAFAARYDGNQNVLCVEIGVGDGGETKVSSNKAGNELQLWDAIGYTDAKWLSAIQAIIDMYAQTFTKTPLALMPDASFIGKSQGYSESMVVNYATKYGIWLQENGLFAGEPMPGSFSGLKKGYPLILEQRNPTSTSHDKLDADLSTAIGLGAVAVLIFSSDLQSASNQATLAKYAALVK